MLLPDARWPTDRLRGTERFCPLSLGDWMKAAERAGVPAVPATEIAVFERDDVLKHEYAGPHQARMDAAYERIAAAAKPGTMLRWDCCSSGSLKATLSEGDTPDARTLASLPIDARIQDAAYKFPRVLLPVWQRPWLGDEMLTDDGYAVEYRALVEGGELRGISSYYIQRPLRRDDAEMAAIGDAAAKPDRGRRAAVRVANDPGGTTAGASHGGAARQGPGHRARAARPGPGRLPLHGRLLRAHGRARAAARRRAPRGSWVQTRAASGEPGSRAWRSSRGPERNSRQGRKWPR